MLEINYLNKIKSEYELIKFEQLCEMAKMFLFDWLLADESSCVDMIHSYNIIDPSKSPIEQIFTICYYRYICDAWFRPIGFIKEPIQVVLFENLKSQENIRFGDVCYIADFTFDLSVKNKNGDFIYPKCKDIKYVIELDGYEYHSSKKQVNSDYTREQDLQELGFRVVRFTGSQIYNEPYTCIEKLVKIILNDIEKRSI